MSNKESYNRFYFSGTTSKKNRFQDWRNRIEDKIIQDLEDKEREKLYENP